jgi:hypothetical protein
MNADKDKLSSFFLSAFICVHLRLNCLCQHFAGRVGKVSANKGTNENKIQQLSESEAIGVVFSTGEIRRLQPANGGADARIFA